MDPKSLNPNVVQTIKRFSQQVKHQLPVDKIILFGSQARGNAHDWSDIDICVISPRFGKNLFLEKLRLDRIADPISTKIEPTPMHPDMLNNKYNTLASEIRKYGIELN